MDLYAPYPTEAVARVPTHPIECLRTVILPECAVCGQPTNFYCGGCLSRPAFCSSEHFLKYWPIHSVVCERNPALYADHREPHEGGVVFPYPGSVSVGTRSAVPPPYPSYGIPSSTNQPPDQPVDKFQLIGFHAHCAGLVSRLVPVNISPDITVDNPTTAVVDYFDPGSSIKYFVIRRDARLRFLDNPYHVFYCAESYEERQNPNYALIQLTRTVDTACRRPWYGTILALKFATKECRSYVDMIVDDVLAVRDYFALYA